MKCYSDTEGVIPCRHGDRVAFVDVTLGPPNGMAQVDKRYQPIFAVDTPRTETAILPKLRTKP